MTLDEAIKLTEHLFVRRPNLIDKDYDAAIKLGIEALKRVKKIRHYKHDLTQVLLPGETED